YFDAASEQKPLLHLWSIAVEEQFYLLFPLMLWALVRTPRWRLRALLGAILIVSFALSVWGVAHARAAAFYLLPSRAWELMLGALLAAGAVAPPDQRWLREGMALAGLLLIGYAAFAYTPQMPFPGAAALAPCLGAAMLIHAGRGATLTNRMLGTRPLAFIGLVSYSLYLWHWPVFVFAHYFLYRTLGPWEIAGLIALSFGLAVFSWHVVERPFRGKRLAIGRGKLFAGAAGLMTAAAAFAGLAIGAGGFPERLDPRIRMILAERQDHEPRIGRCFGLSARDVRNGDLCRIGSKAAVKPSFILWGDSHADALLPAVDTVAKRQGRKGIFAGTDSCAPLLGVTRPDAPKCKPFNDAVLALAKAPGITEIILDARWAKNAEGTSWGDEPRGHVLIYDAQGRGTTPETTHAVFLRGLERTVSALTAAGKKVILVGSVPEIGWPVPTVLARRSLAGKGTQMFQALSVYRQR